MTDAPNTDRSFEKSSEPEQNFKNEKTLGQSLSQTSSKVFGKYGRAIAALTLTLSTSQFLFHDRQFLLVSLLVLGGGGVWYGLRRFKSVTPQIPELSTHQKLQVELQKAQQAIVKLDHLGQRQNLLEKANRIALSIEKNLDSSQSNQLQIALVGKTGVGKSSIIKALLGSTTNLSSIPNSVSLPAFSGFLQPKRQIQLVEASLEQAQTANLAIMVVSGDLSESENQTLQALKQQSKSIILAFNQIDLYLPSDRALILEKLQTYDPEAVAISANPKPIIVRQSVSQGASTSLVEHESDQEKIWQENQSPQIEPLKQRLEQILSQNWEDFFYQNLFAQVRSLQTETLTQLNQSRRLKAEPIINRYQWLNAGTMFISPMPALDLFASSAINGQLLIELGKLYDRSLNWEQAKEIGAALGRNLWQLGCIELATTAIATGLKSHTFTYAIGGSTQAICAAYITKVGASSFLDYLEQLESNPEELNPEKLNTLRQLCEKNLLKTQGISVITDLISGIKKANPSSNLA